MESDSTVLMFRAVMISVILHMIILYLLTLFVPHPDKIPEFSNLNVFIASRGNELTGQDPPEVSGLKEEPVVKVTPQVPMPSTVPENAPAPREISNEESRVEETQNDTGSSTLIKEGGLVAEPDLSDLGEGSEAVDFKVSGTDEGQISPSQTSEESLNVSWTGPSARVLKIPEPSFSLPYGKILPDEVKVSFEVLHDGTSVSVKIQPPGSGDLNLDQQIRSYVASFLFESFRDQGKKRTGLFTLNLRHQEPTGP